MEKKSAFFFKIRVLFWPEISALGVFLNFDNERMHPPKYVSDPPPPGSILNLYRHSNNNNRYQI